MLKKTFKHIKDYKFFYIVGITIVSFLIFYWVDLFFSIDNRMQDYVFSSPKFVFEIDRSIASNIIIVGADEESLQQIGQWPWPRDVYANAIDKITDGKAAAIGIDILFTDTSTPESDDALVAAVKRAGNVIIPSYGEIVYTESDRDIVNANGIYAEPVNNPFPALKDVSIRAHINTAPDEIDGVVRQTINQISSAEGVLNSFGIEIYKQYAKSLGRTENVKTFTKYEDSRKRSFFDYTGGPSTYSYLSFADVLADDFPIEYFENNIVLIGPHAEGMMDAYYTPVSKGEATYGVEIWANIIQNLMDGTTKRKAPIIDLLLIILIGLLSGIVFKKTSPLKGAVFLVLLNGTTVVVFRWISSKGIILSLIYIIICSIMLYLTILVLRYIEEYLERQRITNVFGRYVAPQVVDKILEAGEEGLKLGGDKKFISVLFVDIRGFTPMSEKATPEQVVEILNDYLNLCASSIVKEGGTLDKFIGDAAMAIFNAPLDLENHALQAVKTALAMKEGSLELEARLQKKYGRSVKFGIGINTGYAVVGNIGCHFRMDYTAIGDTVNTAARLESNAKPGQILISEATYVLVKDKILSTSLGSISVKGKEEEIKIYEVEGLAND